MSKAFRHSIRKDFFRMCIIGNSGSGKTYFTLKILYPMIRNQYDEVFIFTRSHNNIQYNKIIPEAHIFNKDFLDHVVMIRAKQEVNIKQYASDGKPIYKTNVLLIWDDILDKKMFNDQLFVDLFTNMRHLQTSTILITQLSSGVLNTAIKSNCTHFAIFRINDPHQKRPVMRIIESGIVNTYAREKIFLELEEAKKKASDLYNSAIMRQEYGYILTDEQGNIYL